MRWQELPLESCLAGGEAEMMGFAIDRVRRQFAWKTAELTAEQLRRRHPPSTMTLAGLIKHLAFVDAGFTARAAGRPLGPPWHERDWVGNDDWCWVSAVGDDPNELYALWFREAEKARKTWTALSADGGLDVQVDEGDPDRISNRRRFMIDLLEEYLRHTGQADLLREAIDGRRGNDPS